MEAKRFGELFEHPNAAGLGLGDPVQQEGLGQPLRLLACGVQVFGSFE